MELASIAGCGYKYKHVYILFSHRVHFFLVIFLSILLRLVPPRHLFSHSSFCNLFLFFSFVFVVDFVLLAHLVWKFTEKSLKWSSLLCVCQCGCVWIFFSFIIGFWFTFHKFTHVFVAIQLFFAFVLDSFSFLNSNTHLETDEAHTKQQRLMNIEQSQAYGNRTQPICLLSKILVICFDFVKFARLNEQKKIWLDFFSSFAPSSARIIWQLSLFTVSICWNARFFRSFWISLKSTQRRQKKVCLYWGKRAENESGNELNWTEPNRTRACVSFLSSNK